jgi:nucleotide-binding universal stress UspA family protein
MASRMGLSVDLLLVEPERGARLPHPDHHKNGDQHGESGKATLGPPTDDEIKKANQRYLARHAEEFKELDVKTTQHVRRGKPVDEILKAALDLRADFIAMATRYRGQHARPEKRSVAEEVLWRSRLPVLLVAEG